MNMADRLLVAWTAVLLLLFAGGIGYVVASEVAEATPADDTAVVSCYWWADGTSSCTWWEVTP